MTGSASAFLGAGQFLFAAILSPLVGLIASRGMNEQVAMATIMVVTALLATVGLIVGHRAPKLQDDPVEPQSPTRGSAKPHAVTAE